MLEATKLPSENLNAISGRYVDAHKLLEVLFDEESRPSLRWLRMQQAARKIPSVKIGRLIFFDPTAVKASLERQKSSLLK